MSLLFGKPIADLLLQELQAEIKTAALKPTLAALLVGEDSASHLYVRLKEQAAQKIGVTVETIRLPANTSTKTIQSTIQAWNEDAAINGILVQLPLPTTVDTQAIIDTIDPRKDVDAFHPDSIAALYAGKALFFSPVHQAVLHLLAASGRQINGAKTVLIGNSNTFLDPLAYLLKKAGAFVSTGGPEAMDRQAVGTADIVVVAVGHASFLHRGLTKAGAVLIDVGTNRTESGHVVGDVDVSSYEEQPETMISAVPGGVGPLTIACLLKNTVEAYKKQNLV